MSTFDSTRRLLPDILADIVKSRVRLPDFQRGRVWDDEHVRGLLISIARSFPVGAVMLLETGGEARFQVPAAGDAGSHAKGIAGDCEVLLDPRETDCYQTRPRREPPALRVLMPSADQTVANTRFERVAQSVEQLTFNQ